MEKGLKFAIREGGRTVGAGQVTEIIEISDSYKPLASGKGICKRFIIFAYKFLRAVSDSRDSF